MQDEIGRVIRIDCRSGICVRVYDWTSLNLQSYDQILCAGESNAARLIQLYNRWVMGVEGIAATISHVATFYDGFLVVERLRRPLAFEATTWNEWCNGRGVQVNDFQKWLDNYDGKVYVRKLDFERTNFHIRKLDSFVLGQVGMPYESGIPGKVELLFTGMSIPFFSQWRKRTIEIHCSENNIEAVQDGKLLNPICKPNKMPPFQFWKGGQFERYLIKSLDTQVEIGEAIRIK